MSEGVTIYEHGDTVYTISSSGEAMVWVVQHDGTLARKIKP